MHWKIRPRQLASVAMFAGLVLAWQRAPAYGKDYPNSTFNHTTEFNAAIDLLWDKLLFWGTLVFVIVEGILIYTIIRFVGAATPTSRSTSTATRRSRSSGPSRRR